MTIMSWNVGGGKLLASNLVPGSEAQDIPSHELAGITASHHPDIVMLQELAVVDRGDGMECLIRAPSGYYFKWALSLDSRSQRYPEKWARFRAAPNSSGDVHFGLGLGFMWRTDLQHSPLWATDGATGDGLQFEGVRFDTGLYTGNRDSEPRLALVARFLPHTTEKALDLMVVNLHLTTLRGEREGIPLMDDLGSQVRRQQLKVILNGVVSRYTTWRSQQDTFRHRWPAVWVLAGDFNCVETSTELEELGRMNFVDLNPDKGKGTKSRGGDQKPSITLDYIFAGPRFVALSEYLLTDAQKQSLKPLDTASGSDHLPVIARLVLPGQAYEPL